MTAVAMPDAVLVAHKGYSQNVKSIISKKSNNVPQAENFQKIIIPEWMRRLPFTVVFKSSEYL